MFDETSKITLKTIMCTRECININTLAFVIDIMFVKSSIIVLKTLTKNISLIEYILENAWKTFTKYMLFIACLMKLFVMSLKTQNALPLRRTAALFWKCILENASKAEIFAIQLVFLVKLPLNLYTNNNLEVMIVWFNWIVVHRLLGCLASLSHSCHYLNLCTSIKSSNNFNIEWRGYFVIYTF